MAQCKGKRGERWRAHGAQSDRRECKANEVSGSCFSERKATEGSSDDGNVMVDTNPKIF